MRSNRCDEERRYWPLAVCRSTILPSLCYAACVLCLRFIPIGSLSNSISDDPMPRTSPKKKQRIALQKTVMRFYLLLRRVHALIGRAILPHAATSRSKYRRSSNSKIHLADEPINVVLHFVMLFSKAQKWHKCKTELAQIVSVDL